jgi:hypothetical protein
MAKIKINKLPEGFKLVKGKVVENEIMRDGGMLNTGDQADYGLVTTPQEYYSNTNFNNTDDKTVRYSLSSVPKDRANIEAEGGETVLTDLTNDGQFGLYNITGPRHSAGGVPMFLPEQSFIYSDTEKMKFTKDELADFGINTKKKMSPAKLSKKYELNDYYAHLESPYADKIQAVTSELMLKKNMMNLSKVAFGQEAKKKFEEGVPLAAHPYLVQQGVDPLEFTAKMEAITREEAQMKMIASLPPEQQEQMMMLQQMMAQVDQQEGAPQEQMPQQAMARYGAEVLPQAQDGSFDFFGNSTIDFESLLNDITPMVINRQTQDDLIQQLKDAFNAGGPDGLNKILANIEETYSPGTAVDIPAEDFVTEDVVEEEVVAKNDPPTKKKKKSNNVAFDQTMQDRYTNKWGITFNDIGVGAKTYDDIQKYSGDGLYADASKNIKGFKEAYGNYPGMEEMVTSLPNYGRRVVNPEVLKFQKWFNEVSIPEQVAAMRAERERVGKEFTDEDEANAIESLTKDYGIREDGFFGVETSSRRPFTFKDEAEPTTTTTDDPLETIEQIIPQEYTPPNPDWWKQDQNSLTALGLLDDNLYLPFQPDVQRTTLSPTFDDWRGQVNANNAAADQVANQLGAAGGPQAIANSNIAGTLMEANAKAQRSVNSANVNTANQFAARQGQMDAQFNQLEANRNVAQYDGTQKVLQDADNFRNWRMGENARLQNAALSNRANTFNLNTTYDNYAVDPTTGGMIGMTNSRALQKTGSVADREAKKQQYFNDLGELSKELGRPPSEAEIAGYLARIGGNQPNNQTTRLAAEAREKGFGTRASASKGKEIKKMAVPFYSGKMGG